MKLKVILFILIFLFFLLGTFFLYVFKLNAQCIENPFIYALKKNNLVCSCSDGTNTYLITKDGVTKNSPLNIYNYSSNTINNSWHITGNKSELWVNKDDMNLTYRYYHNGSYIGNKTY